jgi:hypothetical protein
MSEFDAAVRRYFEVGDQAFVWSEVRGGGQVQIGDMTWDTEDEEVTIGVRHAPGTGPMKQQTFGSLPELWSALAAALRADSSEAPGMSDCVAR